ncbi:MAG: type II secretion system F family protein [Acidimicrobiia bacterium]
MIALAALAAGLFAYAFVGVALGQPVRLAWRRPRRAGTGHFEEWLLQADAGVTPVQFWTGSAMIALAVFVVASLLTGAPLVALAPAIAAAAAPRAYYARRRAVRLREVQAAWPDALRDVAASLAAGRSLGAALGELARTGPLPLRPAFDRYTSTARMAGTAPALELVKASLADPTSDRVVEVLLLAAERGGPIVKDVLDDLVVATTKDLKVLDEIETEGLEMKINARAVLVLPWLVLVALTVRGGAFRDFYRSTAGFVVVAVGAALSAVGYVWISRLARSLDERRVFAARSVVGSAP